MVISILIAVLSAAMLVYWIRVAHRLLKEASKTSAAPYERSFERARIRDTGRLGWSLPEGGRASMSVTGVNISRAGALVESRKPLPPGTVVLIHFGSLRTMTTATIRHCTPRGFRFRIGVEFRHPLMRAEAGAWEIILEPAR